MHFFATGQPIHRETLSFKVLNMKTCHWIDFTGKPIQFMDYMDDYCCILAIFLTNVSRKLASTKWWKPLNSKDKLFTRVRKYVKWSNHLKRVCWFLRELIRQGWCACRGFREGWINHKGIKNAQDHHQNPHKPLYKRGDCERPCILLHILDVTDITVSLEKKYEEISRGVMKTLSLGKQTFCAILNRSAQYYPTEYLILQTFQKCSLIQRDKHSLTFKFMGILKLLLILVERIKVI